ncbi:MAG: UDP-glucose 4-epimerase [Parcubacteria group bacterium Gr01-1014_19]|nr:MAG: UDP-glucose 4-epimerase [Parcubacteria group bacterium Gr01-1014_19]
MQDPKSILVTGAAGFIAGNFIRKFQKEHPKTEIAGLDNFFNSTSEAVPAGITFYEGSIRDEAMLEKIFSKHKPEYVFNFAAMSYVPLSVAKPVETSDVNIVGTILVFKKASEHGVKRVIHSSTSAIVGTAKHYPTNEKDNPPDPLSPYAAQKLACEPFAKIFGNLYGLDVVCLRYFNVFGPGQYGVSPYSTVISAWLEAIYFPKNKKAVLFGDGENRRDYCHVDDVVDANIGAMKYDGKFNGEVFHIGTGTYFSVNKVLEMIEKITGKPVNPDRQMSRPGDAKDTLADYSKAKEWFGYEPKVSFEDGLKRTIAWFEQRKK